MSIRHNLLLVLLDGEWHDEQEVVDRLKKTVDPGYCARQYAKSVDGDRTYHRRRRKTDRILSTRKPPIQVSDVDVDMAIDWYTRLCMREAARGEMDKKGRYDPPKVECLIGDGNGVPNRWRISEHGRNVMIGNGQLCGRIAKEFRNALMLRGRML